MKSSIGRMLGFVSVSGPIRVWVRGSRSVHVRVRVWRVWVRVRFVSGSCLGSCLRSRPVRDWFVCGFVSGSCLG